MTTAAHKPLRVLMIEDDENDALLLARKLERGGYKPSWRRADTRAALASALDEGEWDLIISDHGLPRFSTDQALALLRERGLDVPVIILSGTIGEEEAVAAMRAGASDYILKGNTARLLPAVERELRESEQRRKSREFEEQLRHAQKMEAVGRLAGAIAHDFNNILTAILGNCELMASALGRDHPQRKDVEEIAQSGLRAAALTRQLLTFSRKQVLQPRVLDLNAVVTNLEKFLRRLIGEDVRLAIRTRPGLGLVMADPGQIEQVIMNLAVNARDAMPAGGTLVISTDNAVYAPQPDARGFDLPPGPCVMLAVADDGCGMDAAVRARLFEPFFTTKDASKGTGLGLSTVHGIVKQCGGALTVESAPGEGATFRVYLPAKACSLPIEAPLPLTRPARGTETILLVEDDSHLRPLVARMLANFGYTVLTAPGGEAAVRAAGRGAKIHLLMTDVIMPGLDGPSTAEKIRPLQPEIKVLFVSGYADSVIAPKGVLEPGVHLLGKPFAMDVLARRVREILDS